MQVCIFLMRPLRHLSLYMPQRPLFLNYPTFVPILQHWLPFHFSSCILVNIFYRFCKNSSHLSIKRKNGGFVIKIKVKPEDFIVEERADISVAQTGDFCVYLLKKRGWNTVDVLKNLSRKINLPSSDFSYGGKKDKYALTSQFITIVRQGGNEKATRNPPFRKGGQGGLGESNKFALKEINEKNYSLRFMGLMD